MFQFAIFLWKLLAILIVLGGSEVNFVCTISQQSHLCKAMDMPCRKENCDECQMRYYKLNSTKCRDMTFSYDAATAEDGLGTVQIKAYHYNLLSYKQTAFNISFVNISWSNVKFRFKEEGNEMKNTCREFHMSPNSTIKQLFYDCLWSNETYEGKMFSFEYEANENLSVSYKKYSFRVPFAKNIDEITNLENWEIFMFAEVFKNVFGLTTLILHWQPLPEKFFTNTYNITVLSNQSGQLTVTSFAKVTCDSIEQCKFHYSKWYGSVQFGVQPIPFNKSKCFISKSIVFQLGRENTQSLLIGIVSIVVIIPAFIYIMFLLRNYFVRKTNKWIYSVPKLLIIFTPSVSLHINVVFALVEYLKMHCNIEPLVDELHIFHSKSRNPFKWCNEAFKAADAVMIVASPYHKSLRLGNSVYQNTDVLLLRLLQQRLASRIQNARFFVLMLPYCSEEDVPMEAINLRRYFFPKDINKMLKFIHEVDSHPPCLTLKMPGGKDTYKLHGRKLDEAIAETQANLLRNKSEYDEMVMRSGDGERDCSSDQLLLRTKSEFGEMVTGGEKSERDNSSDQFLLMGPKLEKKEGNGEEKTKEKKGVIELAEDVFSEFPGRLDDLNLSGEKTESLVESRRWSTEKDVINLDVLEL